MPEITEGQTATSKDGKQRVVFRGGQWVRDAAYTPTQASQGRATTTNADMKALLASNDKAAAERAATQDYLAAAKAIDGMGGYLGPWASAALDAGAPGQSDEGADKGWLSNAMSGLVGAAGRVGGALYRPFVPQRVLNSRDTMRTIASRGALAEASQLKGAASDRDMALVRTAGLSPSKLAPENKRIVNSAIRDSGLEQARALITNDWIADNGSLTVRNRNGLTYQQAMQRGEAAYQRSFTERQAARRRKAIPAAPPSLRRGSPPTIDLDGNVIR